jgi:hypothetical protein
MRELMVAALYDELDRRQRETLDRHLRSCSACAQHYRQMSETLGVMSEREKPERDEAFWTSYFEQLAPRLESGAVEQLTVRFPAWSRHPAFRAGAAAALILVGVLLGKWVWQKDRPQASAPGPIVSAPYPGHVTVTEPVHRAEAYLQRSKVLLLALANFDPATDNAATLNLPTQRQISESLVQEAMVLKSELSDTAELRLRELVDDLEVILLQIANLENEHDLAAIELVRSSVTNQALLFRIDLSQLSRETEDVPPETPPKTKNAPTI